MEKVFLTPITYLLKNQWVICLDHTSQVSNVYKLTEILTASLLLYGFLQSFLLIYIFILIEFFP